MYAAIYDQRPGIRRHGLAFRQALLEKALAQVRALEDSEKNFRRAAKQDSRHKSASARIALLCYADGERRYILAPDRLRVGDPVISGEDKVDIRLGNSLPLKFIPAGTVIHNIELKPGKGGQLVRSAGAGARLMAREGKYANIKLPSSETRLVLQTCRATIGQLGNTDHGNISIGKAGRSRWLGQRPNVRGVAMNPVDHPHGGGEGRSSGGRHPVTPWGVPTKGHRTRKNRRTGRLIVKRRGEK